MSITTVSRNVTILLYTEAGYKAQAAQTPGVKDIAKNWWNMEPGYMDNGQMFEVREVLEEIFQNIIAGRPFKKSSEYPWWYAVPDQSLQGLYLVVMDKNKSIVPTLENDLIKEATAICNVYGFKITADNRNLPSQYQQINIK